MPGTEPGSQAGAEQESKVEIEPGGKVNVRLNNRVKEDPGSIVIRCQPHCDHAIPPVLTQTSSFPALPL